MGAFGGEEAGEEAGAGGFRVAGFEELLGGHLVGGDVVGGVVEDAVELGEGLALATLRGVGHGEAVAGEGFFRGVGEDFGEGGDLGVGVHDLMVRVVDDGWQVRDPWPV